MIKYIVLQALKFDSVKTPTGEVTLDWTSVVNEGLSGFIPIFDDMQQAESWAKGNFEIVAVNIKV